MIYIPEEEAQGLVEYALILMLVAIVVFAAVVLLGSSIQNLYTLIEDGFGSTIP